MQCSICGKDSEKLVRVSIEGVEMDTCAACSRYGKSIPKKKPIHKLSHNDKSSIIKKYSEPKVVDSIVKNYTELIRKARDKLGLRQIELAKRLNERESLLHNIENGKIEPRIPLAKKLEKTLSITLIEKVKDEKVEFKKSNKKSNHFTIGDFIKVRKR